MSGQFDKETSRQNFEWHRERTLREKKNPGANSMARIKYNINEIKKKHGEKAAIEMLKELNSK